MYAYLSPLRLSGSGSGSRSKEKLHCAEGALQMIAAAPRETPARRRGG